MIYDHQCIKCEFVQEVFCSVAERETPDVCEKCGAPTKYIFTVPNIHFSFKGGSPSRYPMVNHFLTRRIPILNDDNEVVGYTKKPTVWESARDREQYMDRHGLVEAEAPEAETRTMYDTEADQISEAPSMINEALDHYQAKYVEEEQIMEQT